MSISQVSTFLHSRVVHLHLALLPVARVVATAFRPPFCRFYLTSTSFPYTALTSLRCIFCCRIISFANPIHPLSPFPPFTCPFIAYHSLLQLPLSNHTKVATRVSNMDSLTTHPSNAQQARAFTATSSLSFPGGAGDLTPPNSEKEALAQGVNAQVNGQQAGNASNGTGVTPASPATPAATPGATTGSSGIVPTLQ